MPLSLTKVLMTWDKVNGVRRNKLFVFKAKQQETGRGKVNLPGAVSLWVIANAWTDPTVELTLLKFIQHLNLP